MQFLYYLNLELQLKRKNLNHQTRYQFMILE